MIKKNGRFYDDNGNSWASKEEYDKYQPTLNYCINCYDCFNCSDCDGCRYCSNCTNCIKCSYCDGIRSWYGHKASNLVALYGLRWTVIASNSHIQIGCQYHSREKWASFSDKAISLMHPEALEFWKKYKDMILSLRR